MPGGSGSGNVNEGEFNYEFDLGGLGNIGPMFNAMMERYMRGADLSLRDMESMPRRNAEAFELYTRQQQEAIRNSQFEREMAEKALAAEAAERAKREKAAMALVAQGNQIGGSTTRGGYDPYGISRMEESRVQDEARQRAGQRSDLGYTLLAGG